MAYHPTIGQWMQRDPSGYTDGANLQEYTASHPTDATDPTGLREVGYEEANTADAELQKEGLGRYLWVVGRNATLLLSPGGVSGMGWFAARGLTLTKSFANFTIRVHCSCQDKVWTPRAYLYLKSAIRLNVGVANADDLKGRYGHEQRHVQQFENWARTQSDSVDNELEGKSFANQNECSTFAEAVKARVVEKFIKEIRDADPHPPGAEPEGGKYYPPIGAFPQRPIGDEARLRQLFGAITE